MINLINYLFLNFSKILGFLLAFLTNFFIIRMFNETSLGNFNFFFSITSSFYLLFSFGLPNFARRFLSEKMNDKSYSQHFIEIFSINTIISVITFTTYIIIGYSLFKSSLALMLIFSLNLIHNFFDIRWAFHSKQNFWLNSLFDIILKLFNFLLIYFLFTNSLTVNIELYSILLFFFNLFIDILIIMVFFYKNNIFATKIVIKFDILSRSFLYFIPAISLFVSSLLDKQIIGIFLSFEDLYIYSQVLFLVSPLIPFVTSISAIKTPKSTFLNQNNEIFLFTKLSQETLDQIFFIAFPLIIGITFLITPFSIIYYPSFSSEISFLSIVYSFDILLYGIVYLLMEQILLAKGNINFYNKITVLSTILTLLAYILFIIFFGVLGAIISHMIKNIFIIFAVTFYVTKKYNIRLSISKIFRPLFISFFLYIFLHIFNNTFSLSSFQFIFFAAFSGSAFYFFTFFISTKLFK